MFYEVRAKLLFTEEDEARDFFHDCELALAKTGFINQGQPNEEWSQTELLENHHDQDPNIPCELLAGAVKRPEQ